MSQKKRPAAAAAAVAPMRHVGVKRKGDAGAAAGDTPPPDKKREDEKEILNALSKLFDPKTQRLRKCHLMTIYRHWRVSYRQSISEFVAQIVEGIPVGSVKVSPQTSLLYAAVNGSDAGLRVPKEHIPIFLRVILCNNAHALHDHISVRILLMMLTVQGRPHAREIIEQLIILYGKDIEWGTVTTWITVEMITNLHLCAEAEEIIFVCCAGHGMFRKALESSWLGLWYNFNMDQSRPILDVVLRHAEPDGILHLDGVDEAWKNDVRFTKTILEERTTWSARADYELTQHGDQLTIWCDEKRREWIAYTQQHMSRYMAHRSDTAALILTLIPVRELSAIVTMLLGW